LLRACPRVAAATCMRLRVVGADPLSVRWLMRRLELSNEHVDLLGSISEEALTQELLRAKALCAPSTGRESFGMVLTRAFASSTPVVASDIEGYNDVAGPRTGLLVPPGDADALADALVALVAEESRRAAMGEAGRRLVEERYSWPRICKRLLEVYGGLTADDPRVAAAAA
ncbi:MAG: glycosyltransferase family 4 protein, partial [Gaiellaceae bacterium]